MASICNDDWASLGVMSGHERKTLRLSVLLLVVISAVISAAMLGQGDLHQVGPVRGPCTLSGVASLTSGVGLRRVRCWLAKQKPVDKWGLRILLHEALVRLQGLPDIVRGFFRHPDCARII